MVTRSLSIDVPEIVHLGDYILILEAKAHSGIVLDEDSCRVTVE